MHQKHPKIPRPALGHYARTEFALVGTFCERIHEIMDRWQPTLDEVARTWYLKGAPGFFGSDNEYDDRLKGSAYDLVLTNGNHFRAARQIVFIDPRKAGTLERRREQLTDIAAVVLCPEADTVPKWLKTDAPVVKFADLDAEVLPTLLALIQDHRPCVRAQILAGGKSTRMGENKAKLVYQNGQTEVERLAEITNGLGLETYLSVREKSQETGTNIPQIADRFPGMGPMGAIATAFLNHPDSAWLVLACDLPLLTAELVGELVETRDSRQYATAVKGAEKPFPEPLIAIYEPRAYQRLLQFLSLGYACPRKLLINSKVTHLEVTDEAPLTNANTPEDRQKIMEMQ